jgi:hypothetical protein
LKPLRWSATPTNPDRPGDHGIGVASGPEVGSELGTLGTDAGVAIGMGVDTGMGLAIGGGEGIVWAIASAEAARASDAAARAPASFFM